jgi:hypothetical protein
VGLNTTTYWLADHQSQCNPDFEEDADDTCLYATVLKEDYILRKLQRGLISMAAWCEHWNIKINEEKTWAIYFPH